MRCNFRMEISIRGNSTCRVVNKIFHSPNRTNRPNRQACKGSLSLIRCNFRMENTICQIEHNIFHSSNGTNRNSTCRVVNKIFHSPNRTNRPNRQACKGSLSLIDAIFGWRTQHVRSSIIFSIRRIEQIEQIETLLVGS